MSERTWDEKTLNHLLSQQFPGAWGEAPTWTSGPNAFVLRSTNLDDDGNLDLSTGAPRRLSSTEVSEKRLFDGDLLLEASGGGPGKPVGRVALFRQIDDTIYVSSNFLRTLRVNRRVVNSSFLFWRLHWFQKQPEIWRFQQQTTGISNLSYSDYLNYTIALPSHPEQRRIAEILAALDQQIQRIERTIDKYEHLRTGSVRALMRDGLSLLIEAEASELVSTHVRVHGIWEIVPLDRLLTGMEAGHSPNLEDVPAGPGEWGVLKVSAIGKDGFHPEENKVARDRVLKRPTLCVRPGDLLMTRANTSPLVGLSCIVRDTPPGLMLSDKTLRLRVDERSSPSEFIDLVLGVAEVRRQIEIAATGTSGSMKNISQAAIKRLMVPRPAPEVITGIIRCNDAFKERIATLRQGARKLRLLKQGLMYDLLTGRVRVPVGEDHRG